MTTRPITLTLTQLRKLKLCHLERHEPLFKGKRSVTVRQALEADVSIPDLLWVAGKLDLKSQIVSFAARVAREVAHLNPDPRVMAAIEAAEAWVREPSEGNTEAAADAAWATTTTTPPRAATWAALAAAAAADAAWAAAAADVAAARAAARAATWAWAAWAAADAAAAAAADSAVAEAAAAAAAAAAANAGLSEQRIRDIFAEVFDPQEPST